MTSLNYAYKLQFLSKYEKKNNGQVTGESTSLSELALLNIYQNKQQAVCVPVGLRNSYSSVGKHI